ncbi:MAG: hypothetical protein H6719_35505 [Sandaracinaceae bacterium]|nr:hypothetical protein [Sandaracinaceae bacterium]
MQRQDRREATITAASHAPTPKRAGGQHDAALDPGATAHDASLRLDGADHHRASYHWIAPRYFEIDVPEWNVEGRSVAREVVRGRVEQLALAVVVEDRVSPKDGFIPYMSATQ